VLHVILTYQNPRSEIEQKQPLENDIIVENAEPRKTYTGEKRKRQKVSAIHAVSENLLKIKHGVGVA
jgi:hypothetical protein